MNVVISELAQDSGTDLEKFAKSVVADCIAVVGSLPTEGVGTWEYLEDVILDIQNKLKQRYDID